MKRANEIEAGAMADEKPQQSEKKKNKLSRRVAKKFQVRAHSNPFSNVTPDAPTSPTDMDWSSVFPLLGSAASVNVLDVGCGYGGFLQVLQRLLPEATVLGLEIRAAVVEYVEDRISKLPEKAQRSRIGVLHCNAMTDMPQLFSKGQIEYMFILFADPHYKKKNVKHRVISDQLLDEYAYVLRVGGRLYVATDVDDLFQWERDCLDRHPLFRRVVDEDELQGDALLNAVTNETDEAIKVKKAGKPVPASAVYQRIARH